jgi:hypothetical protein
MRSPAQALCSSVRVAWRVSELADQSWPLLTKGRLARSVATGFLQQNLPEPEVSCDFQPAHGPIP